MGEVIKVKPLNIITVPNNNEGKNASLLKEIIPSTFLSAILLSVLVAYSAKNHTMLIKYTEFKQK